MISTQNKQRQEHVDRVFKDKMETVKADSSTVKKSILDYPEINTYLSNKFTDVDLTDVEIYIADPSVFKKVDWDEMGGCYVFKHNTIFLKSEITSKRDDDGNFNKLIHAQSSEYINPKDVLVHELIHAVSHKANRASNQFRHMEEEFVYTNCIDFYKQKGMREEEIVKNNFLPFLLNDLLTDYKTMCNVISENVVTEVSISSLSPKEYKKFLDENAEKICPVLINKAVVEGMRMVELYHQGAYKLTKNETPKEISRFTGIEF